MVDQERLDLQNNLRGRILSAGHVSRIIEFLRVSEGDYLEIGCYYGYFLSAVAIQFPDKKVYGIDPYISDGYTGQSKGDAIPEVEEVANYNTSLVDNVEIFKTTTQEFLKRRDIFTILKNVSCVLIDGSHHYEDIVYDLELVNLLDNQHTKFIVFDDLQIADVSRAFDELNQALGRRVTSTEKYAYTAYIYYK